MQKNEPAPTSLTSFLPDPFRSRSLLDFSEYKEEKEAETYKIGALVFQKIPRQIMVKSASEKDYH